LNVMFTPSQLGPRSAAITITDSTVGSPHSVSLSGVGLTSTGPNATLSATSLTFNTQLVGTTSPALQIGLSNYGTTPLNVTSVVASGDFGVADGCGSSLPSGWSCGFFVTLTPSASGSLTGTLTFTDNAPGSPQTVTLSGTGTTTSYTLTGYCFHSVRGTSQCGQSQDLAQCPIARAAVTTSLASCGGTAPARVDPSMGCQANGGLGHCVVQ
jgi:hypothetical protein